MTPEEREKALQKLPPERQQRIREQIQHFNSLPPGEQDRLRERYQRFSALPPETQDAMRRDMRRFRELPPSATPTTVRVSALQPGTQVETTHVANPYANNAYAVSEGQRLFGWYNCVGCHANGGGGMGPPLMDDKWIYGSQPENIVATILQGRPNGMPSFAGRIPEDQAWQIAAYVRSMSGQLKTDVAPNRSDSLSSGPPESRRDKETPKTQEPTS